MNRPPSQSAARSAPAAADQLALAPADWLQCEALRRLEESADGPSLDDAATRRASRVDGGLVERIRVRGRLHADGKVMAGPIHRALSGVRWALVALAMLGGLLGGLAARALLGSDGVVQLSWALLTLLGLPSLMLLIWLLVWLWPKRAARGLPGRALWATVGALVRRAHRPIDRDGSGRALAGALSDYGRAGGARIASAGTHLFWAGYLAGAIGMLAAAFVGLRFDFAWGSTLLATETLAPVIDGMVRLAALWPGVELLDADSVRALLIDRSPASDRGDWAAVLLALLAIAGLLPRLLLAAVFLFAQRQQRLALDLARPGYIALARVLGAAPSASTGQRGPAPPKRLMRRTLARATPGTGPAVAIGVELETEGADQSALVPDAEWLGAAVDRESRRALVQAIGTRRPRPKAIVALCSMARTPDRGTGAWLTELDAIAPVALRLVEREHWAAAGGHVEARAEDWARLAADWQLGEPERDE